MAYKVTIREENVNEFYLFADSESDAVRQAYALLSDKKVKPYYHGFSSKAVVFQTEDSTE